jgi:hypothetical protein
MVEKLHESKGEFEARITIFTELESGRKTPPVAGIRWDFVYAENNPEGETYMIFPEFCDEDGMRLPNGIQLDGTLSARMHIVIKENIPIRHKARISEGTEFYCVEGNRKAAKGVVTKLTGIKNYKVE